MLRMDIQTYRRDAVKYTDPADFEVSQVGRICTDMEDVKKVILKYSHLGTVLSI